MGLVGQPAGPVVLPAVPRDGPGCRWEVTIMMKHRIRLVLAGFGIAFVGAVVVGLIRRNACVDGAACVAESIPQRQEPARSAA